MAARTRLQSVESLGQEPAHRDQVTEPRHERPEDFGVWLTSRACLRYIPCPTLNAFYQWCHRYGIVRRANGTVLRRDLDRVLNRKKKRRVMSPASLANLRRRSA